MVLKPPNAIRFMSKGIVFGGSFALISFMTFLFTGLRSAALLSQYLLINPKATTNGS